MSDLKLAPAAGRLEDFADQFELVFTITNAKGKWMCRCTKKHVQIFVATGESLHECIVEAAEKVEQKRSSLGV